MPNNKIRPTERVREHLSKLICPATIDVILAMVRELDELDKDIDFLGTTTDKLVYQLDEEVKLRTQAVSLGLNSELALIEFKRNIATTQPTEDMEIKDDDVSKESSNVSANTKAVEQTATI